MSTRPAAVAGAFYPGDARELRASVDGMLAAAHHDRDPAPPPKALVVPHAGYVYSGPIAATAYATLAPVADTIRRVVLLGPAHRVAVEGMALPAVDAFRTPLGDVPVDADGRAALASLPGVVIDDRPHAHEHSLEVQLPFLQRTLGEFAVLPILVGRAPASMVALALDAVWDGVETLIVVSSDLSHYETHESAAGHDRATADAIVGGLGDAIGPYDACGAYPLRGLLEVARARSLQPRLLDLRTSGDTAGDRNRVVGYGAFAVAGAPG